VAGEGRWRLRTIAEKLIEKAMQGDLEAIEQVADRLDGKPSQAIERGDVPVEPMTDQQLMAVILVEPFANFDKKNLRMDCPPLAAK
jgi:hypothetical protein